MKGIEGLNINDFITEEEIDRIAKETLFKKDQER